MILVVMYIVSIQLPHGIHRRLCSLRGVTVVLYYDYSDGPLYPLHEDMRCHYGCDLSDVPSVGLIHSLALMAIAMSYSSATTYYSSC